MKVSAASPDGEAIRYAAQLISRGRVVGVPTDTFYGLAADPFNLAAVEEIYRVKGRPDCRVMMLLNWKFRANLCWGASAVKFATR